LQIIKEAAARVSGAALADPVVLVVPADVDVALVGPVAVLEAPVGVVADLVDGTPVTRARTCTRT